MTTYHDLFRLCKIVHWVAVERHLAQWRDGNELFWHDLGWIEHVETKLQLIFLVHDLHTELS